MAEVVTVTLAESASAEDAKNEQIVDAAFAPHAPLSVIPAEYGAGNTYAKGDFVTEAGVIYRSQEDGNKGHEPKGDTDFVHWAPAPVETYPLQNPGFGFPDEERQESSHADQPPERSDAEAPAEDTISPGVEATLGV